MDSRRSSTATIAPAGDEFLRSMAQVRSSLRKKLLRKPNYLAAAKTYEAIAANQNKLEFPEGMAIALTAAGDVYSNIKRMAQAAECYTKAARTYMNEELELKKLFMPSIEDNLINALECYHRAISVYEKIASLNPGSSGMVASLCYETGVKLQRLERFGESLWFLEKAANSWVDAESFKVACLLCLAKSQVKLCELEAVELTFHEVNAIIGPHLDFHSFEETHQSVQIALALLMAYLAPSEQMTTKEQRAILDKYNEGSDDHLDRDLFLTLKSILECCREKYFDKMSQHYNALIPYCEETEIAILDELVKTVCPYCPC